MATLRMSLAYTTGKPGTGVVCGQWLVQWLAVSGKIFPPTSHWPLDLEAFISGCRIETHVEGISRQIDRNRIVNREVDCGNTRGIDPLYRDLLGLDGKIVFLDLAKYIVANVFVRLLQIGAIHQRHGLKIVLQAVIGQHNRGHLEQSDHHGCDHKKSHKRFDDSHSLKCAGQSQAQSSRPGLAAPLENVLLPRRS
jgi:hypothetical protein